MEEKKELTCICCPLGCQITVTMDNGGVKTVEGNTCGRGAVYARKELTNPTRIVTSSVKVIDGEYPVVSVKTASDIPKDKIFECMKQIKAVSVTAPVNEADVIIQNIADTGIALIATRQVRKRGCAGECR